MEQSRRIVRIDGSFGEGGGQILRTSIALSAITGLPVEVTKIRAKRENPGLRPQHIGAIRAVATLCDAKMTELRVGADRLLFTPGEVHSTSFKLDVGSAGSITLLLQAIIPAVALSERTAEMEIVGGTDVRWSPTMDYFTHVVLPAYRLLGISVDLSIVRRGYYPKGGGIVKVKVGAAHEIRSLALLSARDPPPSSISVCSNLPRSVAERQLRAATNHLSQQGIAIKEQEVLVGRSLSPGSSIVIYSVGEDGPFIGGDSIGERGKPAEVVGREAAQMFTEEYCSGAPVDRHMGDMLVPLLAFSKEEAKFRVSKVTQHLLTNLHVSSLFARVRYKVDEGPDGTAIVSIKGVD